MPKNAENFYCNICDFRCSKQSNFVTHLGTLKHKRLIHPNEKNAKNENAAHFICVCGKSYKHMSSLCQHKKKCDKVVPIYDASPSSGPDLKQVTSVVMDLVKQNQELTKQIMELSAKENVYNNCNITNNTMNNTVNNKFNLNIFLNETCKDALNIMDFIQSLELQLQDLENVGKLGFSEGISKIFVNGLRQLELTKRPIHCSDLKREIMYIKDSDTWQKDTEEKSTLKNVIKKLSHKNIQQIPEWKKINPEYGDGDSKTNDQYLKIVSNSMGGYTQEEDEDNYNKIIKTIAKNVTIDKTPLS